MLCELCLNSDCVDYLCYECDKYICDSCINNHLHDNNGHRVASDPTSEQSKQDDSDADLTLPEVEYCKKQNGTASILPNSNLNKLSTIETECNYHHMPLNSFCVRCNKLMCLSCQYDHRNHSILLIESEQNMSLTMQLMALIKLQDACASFCDIQKMTKNLYTQQDKRRRNIQKHFEKFRSDIDLSIKNVGKVIQQAIQCYGVSLNHGYETIAKTVASYLPIIHGLLPLVTEVNDDSDELEEFIKAFVDLMNIMEDNGAGRDGTIEQVDVKLTISKCGQI